MRRRGSTSVAVLMITALSAVLLCPIAAHAAVRPGGDPRDAARYYFMVSSTRSNKCLAVADASTADGAAVIQETCDESAYNQHWSFFLAEDDFYIMVARHSNKCLSVVGASTANNAAVVQQTCAGADPSQQWSFPYVGGNNYLAVARHSGRCLTVLGTGMAEGAAVIQRTCRGSTNQQWRLGYY